MIQEPREGSYYSERARVMGIVHTPKFTVYAAGDDTSSCASPVDTVSGHPGREIDVDKRDSI